MSAQALIRATDTSATVESAFALESANRPNNTFGVWSWPAMDETDVTDAAVGEIPIDRCRELLGDEAIGLADEEVEVISRHADTMAHAVIELFLGHRPTIH